MLRKLGFLCSPPGSSVHRISQARIMVWVAMPSTRRSLDPWMEPTSPAAPALQADSSPLAKNSPANAGDVTLAIDPWVGKIPWRRAWQLTLVFLPGKSHGQRSLQGYDPVHLVQLLGHVKLFVTPWTTACQAFLSITNSQSLLKLMSIK